MCGASMATTAGVVSVSKRMPITLSYSNALDRSPNGAPKRAPAFRTSARLSVADDAGPRRTGNHDAWLLSGQQHVQQRLLGPAMEPPEDAHQRPGSN